MSSQPPIGANPSAIRSAPGVPVIRNVNWGGLKTLYVKEVRRFFKVQLQTVWAPAITTLLFLVVFTVALGARSAGACRRRDRRLRRFHRARADRHGDDEPRLRQRQLLAAGRQDPGDDRRLSEPPLSTAELLAALVGGAVTRAFCVGCGGVAGDGAVAGRPRHPARIRCAILWFGLLGSVFLALLGVLTSIWAEKFDHAAAVTNFVVAPLTLLSGTFYSVDRLAPAFRAISHANPFFYIISGFRYGFLGIADSPVAGRRLGDPGDRRRAGGRSATRCSGAAGS